MKDEKRGERCSHSSFIPHPSSFQQTVIHERLADARFSGRIKRAKREAEFSCSAAQELHGRLNGDGVGRDSEHVSTEGKEFLMLALGFANSAGIEGGDQGF